MRLIDAYRLFEAMLWIKGQFVAGIGEVVNAIDVFEQIKDAPTIDAVQVVRCRDCEYWKCNPNTKNYGVCRKVSYDDFEVVMEKDDFCSYSKRREDGEA